MTKIYFKQFIICDRIQDENIFLIGQAKIDKIKCVFFYNKINTIS